MDAVCAFHGNSVQIMETYFSGGGISGRSYFAFDTSPMYNLPTRYMYEIWSYEIGGPHVKNKHLTKTLAPVWCIELMRSSTHGTFDWNTG